MHIYFVTNDKWWSKLHRWGLNEKSTHLGLCFFKDELDIIVDCTKPHGKVYHADYWFTKYRMVYHLEVECPRSIEHHLLRDAIEMSSMTPYDWGAYFYYIMMVFRLKLCGKPLPERNMWGGHGRWCTEIIDSMFFYFQAKGIRLDWGTYDMKTPEDLYDELKQFNDVIEHKV